MALHFENDYNEGVHPKLLEALIRTNTDHQPGYGEDAYSRAAADKIRQALACPQAQIQFLVGGTQTNQVAINSLLHSYQGVIAAETGHIATHEAGAIEFSGHKVITLSHDRGKLSAKDVRQYLEDFYADTNHPHMVQPGMVYISHPTEYGALYGKAELEELATVCQSFNIPLYLDGARLGYALGSPANDLDLPTIAELCSVFYIGGTKLGALIGEALVFTKNNMPKHFATIVKQHGALLAKGRVPGVQFEAFFTDNLYQEIGQEAIAKAERLKELLSEKGFRFYYASPTNQQFIILANADLPAFGEKIAYSFWEKYDDQHSILRLATSWSTSDEDMAALEKALD